MEGTSKGIMVANVNREETASEEEVENRKITKRHLARKSRSDSDSELGGCRSNSSERSQERRREEVFEAKYLRRTLGLNVKDNLFIYFIMV